MDNDPILEMRNIRKIFPGVLALDDVHFNLRKGEVHILLGENGAGKSTLMKILSGACQKTEGSIFLEGTELDVKTPNEALDVGISTIYQELNLVPSLTVGENIFLGREPTQYPGVINYPALYESAQSILDEFGANIDARSLIKDLGIAEQQIVEVAKAISLKARILIMDEPTSALATNEIKQLFTTIHKLKTQQVAIVYISHRLEELWEIGDRVTVLRDGKSVGTRAIDAVSKPELIRMMVDRELTEQYPKQTSATRDEVLRVQNLNVGQILRNINFTLNRGEVLGIAGLLGSGRTELARALFGLSKFDSGEITVRGTLQRITSPRAAINLGIGFLTEDRKSEGLILILSLRENIMLPSLDRFAKLGIIKTRREVRAAQSFVDELRIKTPGINQKVMFLSGGNQQKVVLSKWLCSRADILIFDEPTRGIDVGSKVEIYRLMNNLTARGVGILMISSELPEILGMSDRILVMQKGRIAGEFRASVANQENILQCALGE